MLILLEGYFLSLSLSLSSKEAVVFIPNNLTWCKPDRIPIVYTNINLFISFCMLLDIPKGKERILLHSIFVIVDIDCGLEKCINRCQEV